MSETRTREHVPRQHRWRPRLFSMLMALCLAIVGALLGSASSSNAAAPALPASAPAAAPAAAQAVQAQKALPASVKQFDLPQAVLNSVQTPEGIFLSVAKAQIPANSVRRGIGIYVPAGPHLKGVESNLWLGDYCSTYNGVTTCGFCVQSGKPTSPQPFGPYGGIPGQSSAIGQQAAWIVSKYGSATGNLGQMAAVSAALKALADPRVAPDWTTWYRTHIPANVYNYAVAMINEARAFAGPHVLQVSVSSVYPGQQAQVVATVRVKATGRLVPNVSVPAVRIYNGTLVGRLPSNTGPTGVLLFKVTSTAIVGIRVDVEGAVVQSTKLIVTTPSAFQMLVSWFPGAEVIWGSATGGIYRPAAPKVSQNCNTTCTGKAPVTVTPSCNAPGAAPKQTVIWVNGAVYKTILLAGGKCGSLPFVASDRDKVCAADRYIVNGRPTAFVTAQTCVVVDCPPLPSVHITLGQQVNVDCPCGGSPKVSASATAVVITATKNGSHAVQVLIVNGLTVKTWSPGQTPTPYVLSVSPKTPITVQSGTYKLDNRTLKQQTNLDHKSLLDLLQS